ncbi:NAD(P)/FAD-dependent oxidoreductase [Maliponia aquimaris]|uniref:4-methylaminobutanoate oxidase (Formaldehyde-forming) n=1 Tax=Maliponia aquimaris TaxID=1673631 RepID=A0A238KH11_9RHOB|nr:FAD-binding oxidoreductase [Maliponia aquimaris]SMX41874.1 4-methylaminobutanoate oxidase (formaldehyde-forming) [Maliponia aquimaris]
MATPGFAPRPTKTSYDVVIIGGAIMGSSTAWFLSDNPDFTGSVLVIERDPSYSMCSTAHTNSCIRQQFSDPLNVRISQFTAEFIRALPDRMRDSRAPRLNVQNYGYLYLADNDGFAEVLRENAVIQRAEGAETELLTRDEIAERYPFYQLDDIVLGSINRKDEGYWDGGTLFEWFRRSARDRGVEYVANEVVGLTRAGNRITGVTLASGETLACGHVVNASGPRAARTAAMAGIPLPVEPRKRFTWVFTSEKPLDRELPLTIDPSGVHVRQDGPTTYLAGCPPQDDHPVDPTDFTMHHNRWLDHAWPIIATRIPAFDSLRIVTEWAGHYAYNTLDQNAILGPHPEITNFLFQNGFSGHGLQQSPAMGRGLAEWLTYGAYRSLDLTRYGYDRIAENRPMLEKAVI